MSGRPKQPVYQYSSEGAFLKKWECQSDVRRKYFKKDNGKRPLFQDLKTPYRELPDGTYIASFRIGRDNLMKAVKLRNCPFCRQNKKSKAFSVYNMLGKKIAGFASITIAENMTGIDGATIQYRLSKGCKYTQDNLIYKYD